MKYEMYADNYLLLALDIVVSLAITVLFYGAGPFLYWKIKWKSTTVRRFRMFCIIYTVIVWILFRIVSKRVVILPAFLWGPLFYHKYKKKIVAVDTAHKDDSSTLQDFEQTQSPSFYESEKSEEQSQVRKFGPLDPPEKRNPVNKAHLFIGVAITLILCLGCTTVYSTYRISALKEELSQSKQDYETLKEYRADLLADYVALNKKYEEQLAVINQYEKDQSKNQEIVKQAAFLRYFIGFIVNGSNYYHSYNCDVFQQADIYWAHNVEYCESIGYSACPDCW